MDSTLSLEALCKKQTQYIVLINFWGQFAVYSLNIILILFLTRSLSMQGAGMSQAQAYAFLGISQATGYLMPILGGFMADNVLGIRRSILFGSTLIAMAYLLLMLSGYTLETHGNYLFIAAYALIPCTNSLLMGTASGMISRIHAQAPIKAKSAMTYYYMAINAGALLATIISPQLLDSRFGPLSVLAIAFIGKSFAALNFARHYAIYDNQSIGKDKLPFSWRSAAQLLAYLVTIYLFTLFAYSHIFLASIIISIGSGLGILWFLFKTCFLSGDARTKQFIAILLILEAIVFFVIYNQMNSTLVMFAKNNTTHTLFSIVISPAQYQMINPLLIILLGLQLPRFYRKFPRFSIPHQFACGTLLAGSALLWMVFATTQAENGIVNGNYLAITYVLITIAELWVSAIGLSMIGLYCDIRNIAFAMGVWYLASSLSHALSGRLAGLVALSDNYTSPIDSLLIFQQYYLVIGCIACLLGLAMLMLANRLFGRFIDRGMALA